MDSVIYVNQFLVNQKDQFGEYLPPITIRSSNVNTYCNRADIIYDNTILVSVIYDPNNQVHTTYIEDYTGRRIYVDKVLIKSNKKNQTNNPVLNVDGLLVNGLTILYNSTEVANIVYSPDNPLTRGTCVWVETIYPITTTI